MTDHMTLEEFKSHIDSLNDGFLVLKGNPLSQREINKIQKRMGFKFPKDYMDFLKLYGSLYVEVDEKFWRRIENPNIRNPGWFVQYGFVAMGLGKDTPDTHNAESCYSDFHSRFNSEINLLPIFKQVPVTEYYYCLDEFGTIYFWAFDEPWPKQTLENYFSFLSHNIDELEGNKNYIANNREYVLELINSYNDDMPG
jgi:hypothetical protein